MHYKEGVPFTFMGCVNPRFEDSHVIVLSIPYEGTTSYKGGTRLGPEMILRASCQTEVFDAELKTDITEHVLIHTAPKMESNLSSPENMVQDVYRAAKRILEHDKFLLILGGEHSISAGAAKAYAEKFRNLTVLQIDAHADLRDEFEGTRYSHACTMRRIRELGVNVVQVGIRSLSAEEHEHISAGYAKNIFWAPFSIAQIKGIIEACTQDVYLTIDVDGFDPGLIPATGTAVPGGLMWYESLELFRTLFRERNVVGMDMVELADCVGGTVSEDTVATLLYRLLGYKFKGVSK
jgi:agmatinase